MTKNKIKIIAKNKGIKNYQNMSKEELTSALDKLKSITENVSRNELKKIVKIQNRSLDELDQITEMNNFSGNKLKQIAIKRHIENYEYMLKEDLLIALLKSNQSHTELRKSEDNNTEIGKTKKVFNELRNNFSKEEIKKISRKFRFREGADEYLKNLEKKRQSNKERKA